MSPRSEEFAAAAREGLEASRVSLEAGHFRAAVATAYYAMLYAARAALSERDLNAKTHGGTWSLFREHFVIPGLVDGELAARARVAERLRYDADYDAAEIAREVAETVLADADRFVTAVLATLD